MANYYHYWFTDTGMDVQNFNEQKQALLRSVVGSVPKAKRRNSKVDELIELAEMPNLANDLVNVVNAN